MADNVVVIRFTEPSVAYEALSVLKQCDADGRLALASSVVVERSPRGDLRVRRGTVNDRLVGTASGRLIGMLVGVFGRPLGLVLGSSAGALMGGAFDVEPAEKSDDALTALGRALPPGSTAVIASVSEPVAEVLDGEMGKLGGEVTRRPTAEVMDDLDAAEDAARAAAGETRRTMRETKKAELTADFEERVGKPKEKLHV
jgi:uncharacterized membrane protein